MSNSKWFASIGGWLVAYGKESKQFGDCTSSNLLFSALRKMSNKPEEEPPSLKSGFEDIAVMQNEEIVIGGKDKYRKEFRDALMKEIKKHHDKVVVE